MKKLLDEAQKYHINLAELESLDNHQKVSTMIQLDDEKEDAFLDNVDIKLKDVCYKMFQISNRLAFVIRDDKIEYANRIALSKCGVKSLEDIKGKLFFTFIAKENWNLLATNIGDMLTKDQKTKIKMAVSQEDFVFEGIYLQDKEHFSFILLSEPQKPQIIKLEESNKPVSTATILNIMYDKTTGLPSFALFEDRLQMTINHETYKDNRLKKNYVSVIGISIDNLPDFKTIGLEDFVLKKIANNLVQGLKKNYTVARGVKHPFWILLEDIFSPQELALEVQRIENILNMPIKDNISEHFVTYRISRVTFPEEAQTARRMLEMVVEGFRQ